MPKYPQSPFTTEFRPARASKALWSPRIPAQNILSPGVYLFASAFTVSMRARSGVASDVQPLIASPRVGLDPIYRVSSALLLVQFPRD